MSESRNDRGLTDSVRHTLGQASKHIPDRARSLPGLAVRTAVVGIGKILQVTGRLRPDQAQSPRENTTGTAPNGAAERAAGTDDMPAQSETPHPNGDGTLTAEPTAQPSAVDPETSTAPKQPATTTLETEPETASDDSPPRQDASGTEAAPKVGDLPLPNYDELTVGSLRARLRNLTISDLGRLLAYERAHENRSNVVTMYENRILKLQREQQ